MDNHVFKQTDRGLQFVGDFDGLYRTESDPWEQSATDPTPMGLYYEKSRRELVDFLKRVRLNDIATRGRFVGGLRIPMDVLEVGCGYGYVTELLGETFSRVCGVDVSGEAIRKAREIHTTSGLQFVHGDILDRRLFNDAAQPKYQVVLWSQVWWYIMRNAPSAFYNSLSMLKPGGYLVVYQGFLRNQQYGKEIADGFFGAVELLSRIAAMNGHQAVLTQLQYDNDEAFVLNDGFIAFRKT